MMSRIQRRRAVELDGEKRKLAAACVLQCTFRAPSRAPPCKIGRPTACNSCAVDFTGVLSQPSVAAGFPSRSGSLAFLLWVPQDFVLFQTHSQFRHPRSLLEIVTARYHNPLTSVYTHFHARAARRRSLLRPSTMRAKYRCAGGPHVAAAAERNKSNQRVHREHGLYSSGHMPT